MRSKKVLGVAILVATLLVTAVEAQAVSAAYIYTLSSFTGSIRQNFSRVVVDRDRNETYVLYQNVVTIFNDSGMEVYQFGDDLDLGHVVDIAVNERGDILLLVYRDSRMAIVRCDYRGRPQSEIALKGFPRELLEFGPNRMVYQRGTFYLASTLGLQIVTVDHEGNFAKSYDLFKLFELEEKDRGGVELGGFNVDADGNMLMTVPTLFRAFVLSPEGELTPFGKPSSAPGGFNIVGGIARDSKGNFVVVDRLKGSVLVFSPKYVFMTQFSTRGYKRDQLIFPAELAIDGRDRVYVTQMGKRGVSVFALAYP